MNKLMKKQIRDDYREILSRDAGLRIFGSIFLSAGNNSVGQMSEYWNGRRDLGIQIANTIREIDPHLIAECELAYQDFIKEFGDNERGNDDDDSGDYYSY